MSFLIWSVSIKRLLTPSTSHSPRLSFDYSRQNVNSSSSGGLFSFSLLCSFVAECVFQDLSQAETTNTTDFRRRRQVRRFARTDCFGLGAVLVYEIPFNSSEKWTLKSVFGFEDNMFNGDGMSQQELLQGIDARIAYIPLYACTSFVTGQMVNAFFRDIQASAHEKINNMNPICVPGGLGFAVDSDAFDLFDHGLGHASNSEGDCDSTNSASTSKNPIQILNLIQYLTHVPDTQVAPRFRVDRDSARRSRIGDIENLLLDRVTVVTNSHTAGLYSSRAFCTSHTETYPSTPPPPKSALPSSKPSFSSITTSNLSSLFGLGPSIATSYLKQPLLISSLKPFLAQVSVLPILSRSLVTPMSTFTAGTSEHLDSESPQLEGEHDDWELEWVETELLLEEGRQPVRGSGPLSLRVEDTFENVHSEGTLEKGEICLDTIGDSVRFDTNLPSIPSVPLILPLTDTDLNPSLSNFSSSSSITSSTSTLADTDLKFDPGLSKLSSSSSMSSKNIGFPKFQHLRPVSSTEVAYRFRVDRDQHWGRRVDEYMKSACFDSGVVKGNTQSEGGKERKGDGERDKEKENIPPSAIYVNS